MKELRKLEKMGKLKIDGKCLYTFGEFLTEEDRKIINREYTKSRKLTLYVGYWFYNDYLISK